MEGTNILHLQAYTSSPNLDIRCLEDFYFLDPISEMKLFIYGGGGTKEYLSLFVSFKNIEFITNLSLQETSHENFTC